MTRRAPRFVLFAFAASAVVAGTARAQQPDSAIRRPAQRIPPAAVKAPAPLLTPPDSAVALCVDGTWIREPGVVGDCSTHGGLKVAMPERQKPPAVTRTAPLQMRAIVADQAAPANATGRCKDGTFLTGPVSDNSCSDHGGLAVRFPRAQAAPPAPPRRP